MFAEAVAAIDNGDLGGLRELIAAHPELVAQRLENGRDDYFAQPYLLWFVAENPIRHGTLPANIAEITRALLDLGAEGRDYTLALVVSGQVSRECGVQLDLIDVLVAAGADRTIRDTLFDGTPDDWFQYLNR